MDEQLSKAYDLIKAGHTAEALPLLETIIRTHRDNDDAWWLYANAVDDPDRKRNALNNILRIGTNAARQAKVQYMLAQLDDPFALPEDFSQVNQPQKKSTSNGVKIVIGMVTLFGACACIAIFSLFSTVSKMVYVPATYDNQGSIVAGETVSGLVDTEGDWDGYTYQGKAGEELIVSVRPVNSEYAPFVALYGPDDVLIGLSRENEITVNRLREELPSDDEYTIVIRTIFGVGSGDYDITVTSN